MSTNANLIEKAAQRFPTCGRVLTGRRTSRQYGIYHSPKFVHVAYRSTRLIQRFQGSHSGISIRSERSSRCGTRCGERPQMIGDTGLSGIDTILDVPLQLIQRLNNALHSPAFDSLAHLSTAHRTK
jgi:hypothetical protein